MRNKILLVISALAFIVGALLYVIAASAPTITGIQIKPSPAYSTDVINCSANYNDADGDKGNLSISWYNGSNLYWQTTQFNKANGEAVNEPLTWFSTNGLVGYWKFSEGNGNEARDISGNGNSGVISSATWTEGKLGKALSFDGINDYANVTNINAGNFNYNDDFTLSAWIKPTAATIGAIISKENKAEDGYDLVIGRDRKITFIVGGTIKDNLTVMLDAGSTKSYSGSGSTWSDLSGLGNDFTGTNMDADDFYGNDSSSPKSFDFDANIEEFHRAVEGIPSYANRYNFTWETWQSARSLSGATYARQAQMDDYMGYSSGIFVRRNQVNGPSAGSPTAGTWQQIIGSGNTTHLSVWLNSNLVGIASHTQAFSGTHISWYVGCQHHAYTTVATGFNGNISLVRSYARELTKDEINQNYMSVAYRYNAASANTAPTALALNEYSNVLATKSGNNCSIYINGIISKSFNCQISQNMNGQLFIGARASGVTEFFNGAIDEVRIYNRALAQAEINEIYTNTPHANGETWNCTINATDSSGATGVPVSTIKTIGGSSFAPTITGIQIKPSPAYSTDVINCSANYNDADGDKGNVSISWYNGSTLYWQATQFNKANGEAFNEQLTWFSTNGLVGYWKFSEGNGNEARDISGNGNKGVISGATWTEGKYGKALQFDGLDDYAQSTNVVTLNGNGEHKTVSAWIYHKDNDQDRIVGVFQTTGSSQPQYSLFTTGTNIRVQLKNDAGTFFGDKTTTGTFSLNAWHHVAFTYDESNLIIYIDGVGESFPLMGEIRTDPSPALYIGVRGDFAATERFNGTIDEVAIYNRSLSALEILGLYQNSLHVAGETWNCTINATDSFGMVGLPNSATKKISSTSMYAPTITNVQIKPSPAYSNEVINCSANYNDADGDNGNVTFSWYNGSNLYWQVTQFNKMAGEIVQEPLTLVSTNGLVAYYKFSEGNGTETRDISGSENNGTLTNFNFNVADGWVQGKYGSGLQFDGSNDWINATNNPILNMGARNLTFSLWMKPSNLNGLQALLFKGDTGVGAARGYGIATSDTSIRVQVTANTELSFFSNKNDLTNGVWYFILVTKDNSTTKLYINGALDKSQTSPVGSTDDTSLPLTIGRLGDSTYYYNGVIDEVMIFNRSLSASEIQEIYASSPHASDETWNCTINATDATGARGIPNSKAITIESSGYEPKWKHVTVTYSASKKEKKIYIDNVLIITEKLSGLGSYKINNQTGNLYVSKLYGVPSGNIFNGSIDEMRIYPYALSSSEVGSAYLNSINYDNLPSSQNEATTLSLNGESVTEMTLAPIVRVSNKERTCEVTSKVKIPKCA